jgi:ribosomal protein S15P/S13E
LLCKSLTFASRAEASSLKVLVLFSYHKFFKEEFQRSKMVEEKINLGEKTEKKVEKVEKEEKKVNTKSVAKPSWVKMKKEDFEKTVVDLAGSGETMSKIGLILRDKHGVPKSRVYGKNVKKILEDRGAEHKTEKKMVEEKIQKLKEHIKKNKHDYTSTRALTKKLWVLYHLEQAN